MLLAVACFLVIANRTATPIPTAEVFIPQIEHFKEPDNRASVLKSFLLERSMPIAEYAELFIVAADTYSLDWRLLPAIGIRESSGGKAQCGHNPFGWGSCQGYNFTAAEEAIAYVSWRLSESPYYQGKDTYEKLRTYNSEIETYPDEVIAIMEMIQRQK